MLNKRGAHLVAATFLGVLSVARAHGAEPSAKDILRRALEVREGVKDFTVIAAVHLRLDNADLPDNRAKVYFKRPDQFRVQPLCGIVAIPKEALVPTRLREALRENADVKLIRKTSSPTGQVYVLEVQSREDPALGRLQVWVNAANSTLTRMEAFEPGRDKPVLALQWQHTKVDALYWMPAKITCRIDRDAGGGHRAMKGTAEIALSDYKVNTNLPDSAFESAPKRPPRPRFHPRRRW